MYSPVAIFAYNRPKHLKRVLDSLLQNPESKLTTVYIFCDGAKNENNKSSCEDVYKVAFASEGFKEKFIIKRDQNFGLAKSIIAGIDEVLEKYNNLIVLEDDIIVSNYFLNFMNSALEIYEDEDCVGAINSYLYPVDIELDSTVFLKGSDCWGWATWKRAWNLFQSDGSLLLSEIRRRNLEFEFEFDGTYPYLKMLENQVLGKNNSWAIRWQASLFLAGMHSLLPYKSLVKNIGNDNTGVHSGSTDIFDVEMSNVKIEFTKMPVVESEEYREAVKRFHKKIRSARARITRLLRRIFYK